MYFLEDIFDVSLDTIQVQALSVTVTLVTVTVFWSYKESSYTKNHGIE